MPGESPVSSWSSKTGGLAVPSFRQKTEWVMPAYESGSPKHSTHSRVGWPSSFWCGAHVPSCVAPHPDRSKAATIVWNSVPRNFPISPFFNATGDGPCMCVFASGRRELATVQAMDARPESLYAINQFGKTRMSVNHDQRFSQGSSQGVACHGNIAAHPNQVRGVVLVM